MVYQLISPVGKSYIGVTNNLRNRLYGLLGHKNHIGKALREYGQENFEIKILGIFDKVEAYKFRLRAIQLFNTLSPGGYNVKNDCLGRKEEKNRRIDYLDQAYILKLNKEIIIVT